MRAVFKPFFAFCGLVALSTALSADSRLFPVGAGGAGWGENGFLYSDYLQTAAANGREVEFQGSFVLDGRPFLAELGGELPGRIFEEVESLPLREWGLGYVFEKRRPAHQRALAERGWRLADWLAEETLMAATESSRGGGLIRTLEFDLQSELGGRRAQVGLNVLGALREADDEAIAWQFRGFKSSGGLGGNAGLIYRRAVADNRALAGANVFVDYETYADENFWRGSAGAELRSAWADVFGNVYRGFSDDVKKDGRTTYTADGYDVELNVHSPDFSWLTGEVAYYNFEGKAGDKDDDGVRFGVRVNPVSGLELGVEYDSGDNNDDNRKKWSARIRYAVEFGGKFQANYLPGRDSGSDFEPRDWFFAPVEREYTQRIRKSATVENKYPEFTFAAAALPITVEGSGLDLEIREVSGEAVVMGTINGQVINPPRTLTINTTTNMYPFPVAAALTGTVKVSHTSGQTLILVFAQTNTRVTIRSEVEFSSEGNDFFRLIDGNADIQIGSGGSGTVFIAEQYIDEDNNRRFTIPIAPSSSSAPVAALLLTVDNPKITNPNADVDPDTHLPPVKVPNIPNMTVIVAKVTGGVTAALVNVSELQGSAVLAENSYLVPGNAEMSPIYYRRSGETGAVIVATLTAAGGVEDGGYQWTTNSGGLLTLVRGNVLEIPTTASPTDDGVDLTVEAVLEDGRDMENPANANPDFAEYATKLTLAWTVSYRNIVDLAANVNVAAKTVYGLTGEGRDRVVANVNAEGGPRDFSYRKIGGELEVRRNPGGNGAAAEVYIPSNVLPGGNNAMMLTAELSQPTPDNSETNTTLFSVTVNYVGFERIGANLTPIAPAVATGQYNFAITGERGNTDEMSVLNIAGSGGTESGYAMRLTDGDLSFDPSTGRVYISQGSAPKNTPYFAVIEIDDSGTGADAAAQDEATPTLTLTVRVQYGEIGVITLGFNDDDNILTVHGLEGRTLAYRNVATVAANGGFGGVTVFKEGGELNLQGTGNGAEVYIPAETTPLPGNGRELLITVSANDSESADNNITKPVTATLSVHYVEVKSLQATYLRVNRRGEERGALGNRVLTVGMTDRIDAAFTVAKLMVEGGVGGYTYSGQGGALSVNPQGEVLMAGGTQPGANQRFEIVVRVDDAGDNAEVSPPLLATLSVHYNTIGIIAAEVVDVRDNAVPPVIDASGGKVYFLSGGNANVEFGSLRIFGGLGNEFADYDVSMESASGLTYSGGILSLAKCGAQTPKTIQFKINDKSAFDPVDTTDEITFDFSVVSGGEECVGAIVPQLKDAGGSANADASSAVAVYNLAGESGATVAAVWTATGGGGDKTWRKTGGNLNLTPDNQVQVPQNTRPTGQNLVLVAVVDDEDAKGGFLTEPVTTSVTVNYAAVPGVELKLNHPTGHANEGNEITALERVYGVAGSANSGAFAAIETGGGADGANVIADLDAASTSGAFAKSGDNVNFSGSFPAANVQYRDVVAVVSADDAGAANIGLTPKVEKRATARLIPVSDVLQAGGNIAPENLPNVAASSPHPTEASLTVYVLEATKQDGNRRIARVGAATTDNAGRDGVSRLSVSLATEHSTSGTGLRFEPSGSEMNVFVEDSADATPAGTTLKLVLEYNDGGFAPVDKLTAPLLKTVNVKYVEVAAFAPEVRDAAGNAALTDPATVYAAEDDSTEKLAAKLVKVGGAAGALRVVSYSPQNRLEVKPNGDVFVRAGTPKGLQPFVVNVVLDDAVNEEGYVTPQVTRQVTVEYLESTDVLAEFVPTTGDGYFVGALNAGLRTVYLDAAVSPRVAVDAFRLNVASGSPPYTYDSTNNLDGFTLGDTPNNRILSLQPTVADTGKAYATVKVDDTGGGSALTEPATAAVTVEVKLVTAIAAKFVNPSDDSEELTGLQVMSAAAANSASLNIASVVASEGVGNFQYAKRAGSSAALSVDSSGKVWLAANYTPNGQNTLTIVVAVNDSEDGSTLTDDVLLTLEFVLAETVQAAAFLLDNNGSNLPGGSAGADLALTEARTIRVKTANYGTGQVAVGITAGGGLGAPYTANETGATGLSAQNTAVDGEANYVLRVAVDDSLAAANAPATLALTAIVNDGNDTNNQTDGATLEITVVYDKVDQIAAKFQDTSNADIVGRLVVVKNDGAANTPNHVANIVGAGGTGSGYTYRQVGTGNLIVNEQGQVLVAANVAPAIGLDLIATVAINDGGNWSHVSDEELKTITVRYSSKLQIVPTITDTRTGAVPSAISTSGDAPTIYFSSGGQNAGQVLANVSFSGGVEGSSYNVVASQKIGGLDYNATNKQLTMEKCTDPADKSIRLVVNDSPDDDNVSDPLTLDIAVHSGAAECVEPINAQARTIGNPNGQAITEDLTAYALADVTSTAASVVATVFIEKGAPDYTSTKTGALDLSGSGKSLTVVIPAGQTPGTGNGKELAIDIAINDDVNKGGFLTDAAEVSVTVNYIAVQPHGQFTADKAGDVLGEVSSGVLTVRRVAQSGAFDILTNMRGANTAAERIQVVGNYVGIRLEADLNNANANKLVMVENQPPNGEVRVITIRVVDYALTPNFDLQAQFNARPDRLFTISVYYYGELEGAAYDSENTANAVNADVDRYVEQGDSNVAVAVASLSVSGGAPGYSYNLVGGLELNSDNTTVQIPASANPTRNAGTELTARIVIDDNGRTDTAPLTVDLTANYILIDGHSNLVVTPDGGSSGDLDETATYPLIRGAQSSGPVAALTGADFKTAVGGAEALSKVDGDLEFDATAKEVRVAGGVAPSGQVLTVKLRATDGDSSPQAKARNDRDYAVKVRYLKALSAKALVAENGAEINAVRQISVAAADAGNVQPVAHIEVDGGAGGNAIRVDGNDFVMNGNELQIAAAVTPGVLGNGNALTATVRVNDDETAVGGAATPEVVVLVTANYITLPPVTGSFVNTAGVAVNAVLDVYGKTGEGALTIAATAKAATGNSGETFTYAEEGEGPLEINTGTGEISIPASEQPTGQNLIITVRFEGNGNSVPSTEILTVRYVGVSPISSTEDGFQSVAACHPGNQIKSNAAGSLITVLMATDEAGDVWNAGSDCQYQASGAIALAGGSGSIVGAVQGNAEGLALITVGNEHRVSVASGTHTYTAESKTLSIVIAYNDDGAGSHLTEDFLRTVYVVFPGVQKFEAVLENTSGAGITKPLTVYVAAAGENVVASLNVSGGTGGYTYTGTALESTGALAVNNAGKISVPSTVEPVVHPGTTFKYEVAVDDTGANADVTAEQKVILTLQYIKTSGTLAAAAVLATPPTANNTIFYGAKDVALLAPINVAEIAPSGGIPNPSYNYEIVGNSNLGISGTSGNNIQVQLKIGDTPGTGAAAERAITVKVTDAGDPDNDVDPGEQMVIVRVSFVEVLPHGDLTVKDSDGSGDNLGTNIVTVAAAASSQDIEVSEPDFTIPERPTGLNLVVSQESAHGLRYDNNLNAVIIPGGTVPEGQTLSVVVRASDGDGEAETDPAKKAQKAARQDQLYTIYLRYIPSIKARVEDSAKTPITAPVELTLAAGNHFVGSVSVSGGVTNSYTYTPTPAEVGDTNLEVDNDGNIKIPSGVTPVAGVGLSITVNIAVNDLASADDSGETSAANVQIRVKYVLLEPLVLTVKDLAGADVGATDSVGTFYLLEGRTLTAAVLVATVTASGGIKDYTYAAEGDGGDLTFTPNTRAVHIASGRQAQTPNTAGATLSLTLKATDSQTTANEKLLTVRAVFETVRKHGDLVGTPATGVEGALSLTMTVRRVAADNNAIDVVSGLNPANVSAEDLSVEGAAGDLTYDTTAKKLQIKAAVAPEGQTLAVTLKVADAASVLDAQDAARPDRLFTLSVVYAGMLTAAAINTQGNAPIAAAVNRFVALDEGAVNVATLSVSGGATPYTYAIAGELELHGDNNATVRIPESATPKAHPGEELTARIVINDNANREDTLPLTLLLTVHYILGAGHAELTATHNGTAVANAESGTFALVRPTAASEALAVLSGVGFAQGVPNEVLSTTGGELEFVNREVRIAANANPEGQILTLELKATDGEDSAEARARRDRLYTVRVRYVKSLSAKALDATSSGTEIVATRQIRVSEAEATEAQFVAHIQVEGGAGGNVIEVGGDDFEIVGTELRIVATVVPGDLATGKLLTATVKVNDNGDAVGGAETGEVLIEVTANYITLPPVAGGFVEGRDGNTAVPTSGPVTVYSAWTPNPQSPAPATVAATATAVVEGRSGDAFTFHKIGTGGKLQVDVSSGAVTLEANRPGNPNPGNYDLHVITVEFRALTNAVATRQTLTVRHQMLKTIISGNGGMTSRTQCYPGVTQHNGNNQATGQGTQIIVVLPTREEGTEYSLPQQCDHYVNAQNNRTALDPNRAGFRLVRTARDASGLELYPFGGDDYRVRLAGGTPPTYTAESQTLSIVIVNTDGGPGGHVVPEFLQTVYVVLPGVEKLEAVLQTPAGSAITKPLTVYTGATDSTTPAKVVATVKASGGGGDGYSYDGTALGGTALAGLGCQQRQDFRSGGRCGGYHAGDEFPVGGDGERHGRRCGAAQRNAAAEGDSDFAIHQDIGFAGGGVGH